MLLGASIVRIAGGRTARALAACLAPLVLAHVFLVWHWRFEWSFARAVAKSWAGFAIFHTALLALVAAPFLPSRAAARTLIAAFAVVSLAAVPAPWRYPEIRVLAVPMALACIGTVALAVRARGMARQAQRPPASDRID